MTTSNATQSASEATGSQVEFEDNLKDKFLTFKIGKESYGIAIRHVTEIIGIQKFTEVPESSVYIKGVINLRGKVIPIMDVRLRFGMDERDYDERTCVIVVNYKDTTIGLVVDTVSEVTNIPSSDIEPAASKRSVGQDGYIEGMGKIGDEIVILLEVHKLVFEAGYEPGENGDSKQA